MAEMDFNELQQILSVCLDEIVKLKEDNINLHNENKQLNELVNSIKTAQLSLFDAYKSTSENQAKYIRYLDRALDNMKYEANDPNLRQHIIYPKFHSFDYTMEQIKSGKSLCRFGDGEFDIMAEHSRHKFQNADSKLSEKLREVIASQDDNILIAIADNYGELSQFNVDGKYGIRSYMSDETRKSHSRFLDANRIYHNAYISRPYSLYANNHTDAPKKHFENFRQIWADKDIIIIEGCQSRLGYGNDLFNNAKSIKRIEGPAINSFDRYDDLLNCAKMNAFDGCLFLLALGASATVMAYDLSLAGYQALDIGHIDLEYDWYKNGSANRSATPYKYSNETENGDQVQPINDPKFDAEIIAKIY